MTPSRDYYLPNRQLVSQDNAALTEPPRVPRSKFTGTWTRKMTFDTGYLYPFLVDEVLPGDHLSYNIMAYVRMATPIFPIFDNLRFDTLIFFCPNRLVWPNWVKMMGEQDNPADSIAFTIPQLVLAVSGEPIGSVYDHMGIPGLGQITAGQQIQVNALPLRMYNLIWNEWFRDENIINSVLENTDDGPDASGDYTLLRRAKSHDYFTSALPWPQKFTAPTISFAGQVQTVYGIGTPAGEAASAGPINVTTPQGAGQSFANYYSTSVANNIVLQAQGAGVNQLPYIYTLGADLSFSISTFRQAMMVQALLERDARGGTRYTELLTSHFGVKNPDARIQRPEYIGGGQTPLEITPIAQTAPTTGVPLGALGGAGTAAGQHRASYAALEHGYIIGLLNVRSELSYQQGLARHWTRATRYDYYWPALAQLGEQAIRRDEIYCTGTDALDQTVFGYQERWQELRTRTSEVTGIFRANATGTLAAWHLAELFTAPPTLNATFINDSPPMTRILAAGASTGQQFLADIMISRTAVRPIPAFGTPATLGRF